MSFFSQQTSVVEIDPANRVTIRRLTTGEAHNIKSRYVRSSVQAKVTPGSREAPDEGEATTTIDTTNMALETLIASIVSWEGPGFANGSGESVPVNRANILALPEWVTDKITEGINALGGGGMSDAEKGR